MAYKASQILKMSKFFPKPLISYLKQNDLIRTPLISDIDGFSVFPLSRLILKADPIQRKSYWVFLNISAILGKFWRRIGPASIIRVTQETIK